MMIVIAKDSIYQHISKLREWKALGQAIPINNKIDQLMMEITANQNPTISTYQPMRIIAKMLILPLMALMRSKFRTKDDQRT